MQLQKAGVTLTRSEHRSIKNMNRAQLQDFMFTVYKAGRNENDITAYFDKAFNTSKNILLRTLDNFKGIGPKRKELFLEIYNQNCEAELNKLRSRKTE